MPFEDLPMTRELLLDVALLYLAHKRSWPVLGALSLVGTFLYQMLWVGVRMGPDRQSRRRSAGTASAYWPVDRTGPADGPHEYG